MLSRVFAGKSHIAPLGAVQKYVTQERWVGVVIFVTMHYEKYWGVGGWSECSALRNANEKIENAIIDIAIPKND